MRKILEIGLDSIFGRRAPKTVGSTPLPAA
jgi:hypothetical protein